MNFSDKRTQKRLLQIEEWAIAFFYGQSRQIHHDKIKKVFGCQNNEVSKYLRDNLLIKNKSVLYKVGSHSYEYTMNWNNLAALMSSANIINNDGYELFNKPVNLKQHQQMEKARDVFGLRYLHRTNEIKLKTVPYTECETTGRLMAPFQSVSKKLRHKYYAEWFDYDIKSASYSLLWQHFNNNVLPWWGSASRVDYKVFPLISQERDKMRKYFSRVLHISVPMVKEVLAAILFDAKLSKSPYSGVFKLLVENEIDTDLFYKRAEADIILRQLIVEIRNMWPKMMMFWKRNNASGEDKRRYTREKVDTDTGEIRRRFRSAAFRSGIYFELERQVLNVVRIHLKGEQYRLIHDGMFCKKPINIEQLQQEIFEATGFRVEYSQEILGEIL
jgi:hypothetical protein